MDEPIQQLFKRYLEGKYSSEDLDRLLSYFQLTKHDESLEHIVLDELDKDVQEEEMSRVKPLADNIGTRLFDKVRASDRLRRLSRIARVAAAVLLIGFMGLGVYLYQGGSSKENVVVLQSKYGDEVMPGSIRGSIITDDGTEIPLLENQSGIIVSENMTYSDGTVVGVKETVHAILKTPRGGQYQLTLADGTKVWLNAASTLRYPTSFINGERLVELDGEAYFEVEKQVDKPFVVVSKGQRIKVLGTKFNVNTYLSGENKALTTLIEGSIELENTSTQQKQVLKPGEQALVSANSTLIKKEIDVSDYAAWKDGYFIRTSARLVEILPELERWYDVTFDVDAYPSSSAFIALNRTVKLSEVLDALALNYAVRFKIDGRRVIVME